MALYNTALNAKVKIFSQLYVGLKQQGQGAPDLGFATPYADDAAFKKRKATVDAWCPGATYDHKTGKSVLTKKRAITVDNTLREGFIITDDVKRVYWGGGNVVWRVLDPYGFELEIPSANLMALIQISGIDAGGKIPGKCCWGRDGATNILLHESSDVYMNSIKNAEDMKKAKALLSNDRVVGAKYVVQSGDAVTYLGKFRVHALKTITYDISDQWNKMEHDSIEVQIFTPNGKGCFGDMITREIEDVDVFDAVIVDGIPDEVSFYRKAPLISRLDGPVLSEEAILSTVSTKRYKFASSAKSAMIVHVARKVQHPVIFALAPISTDRYKELLEKAERIASKSIYYSIQNLFYEWGKLPIGYVTSDEESSVIWNGSGSYGHATSSPETYWCPTQYDEKQIKQITCEFGNVYLRRAILPGVSFKTQPAPDKKSVVEWVEALHDLGHLKEIIVVEKVS